MDFKKFTTLEFSADDGSIAGYIYILCRINDDKEIPFYVGQTQSIWQRLNDYYWASFQAQTDFKVGEAIKYIKSKNLRVVAKYKPSADRLKEERVIIESLHNEGLKLLNDCPGFDFHIATAEQERCNIREFVDDLLNQPHKQ